MTAYQHRLPYQVLHRLKRHQPKSNRFAIFVATGNGGHKFTSNLEDHNQAVQDYLRVMREKRASQNSQSGSKTIPMQTAAKAPH